VFDWRHIFQVGNSGVERELHVLDNFAPSGEDINADVCSFTVVGPQSFQRFLGATSKL
jgi:hypothetical protein